MRNYTRLFSPLNVGPFTLRNRVVMPPIVTNMQVGSDQAHAWYGDRLEPMIGMGPDYISLEEGKKNFQIDIGWIDRIVAGRACVFGNLDSVWLLRSGAQADLKKEIRRQIDVSRNYGKFVMSLGSPVTPETSLFRVKEHVKIARHIASS